MTEEILRLQREKTRVASAPAPVLLAAEPPAFLEGDEEPFEQPVFVAREPELARLDTFLQTALAGQGCVFFVLGGPGRGKTALLNEFAWRAMDALPELLVARGSCNAYSGVGDPYLPFREVMDMLTGQVEARWAAGAISRDHARRLWQALPAAVEALLAHGSHVVSALVPGEPLLARASVACLAEPWLVRLRERVERRPGAAERLEQSHLFQQVSNVLYALSQVHPLLLILDDLQWVDRASAGLLFHLGRRLEGARILVAGAYRPEEVAPSLEGQAEDARHPLAKVLAELKRQQGDVWVDLAEVPEPEGREFVEALLETEPNRLGEHFREALYEHAGGHPLFTAELLRAMQERGDLVRDESGRWVPGPALDWTTLPTRVEGVIEERIGRLEAQLRDILTVASVEGEEFTAQVVARVEEMGERQILRRLSGELEKRHRLVCERPAFPLGWRRLSRYRFAHALFQHYLYHDLGEGERALLHGEVARVLEELYEGRTEDLTTLAPQLAYHYSQAGDGGHCLRYLTLAGDGALAAYANEEAEGYYRRALELATAEAERAHLLSGLGEVLNRQGRHREAMATWGQGIELYRALEDSDGLAWLYARSSWAAFKANDPVEDLRLCQEGLSLVEGAPDSPGLARLLDGAVRAHLYGVSGRRIRSFAERALEMAERLGDAEAQAHALVTLGGFILSGDEALAALTRAGELAKAHGLLDAARRAHKNLVVVISLGDQRVVREHQRKVAELSRQAGDIPAQISDLASLACSSMYCGEFREAETMLSQLRRMLPDLAEPGMAETDVLYAEMLYQGFLGEWVECARQARVLQESVRKRGSDVDVAGAGEWLGWVVLESHRMGSEPLAGGWEEAETALSESIKVNERWVEPDQTARAWLGLLLVAQGRLDEARRLLAEAWEKDGEQPFPCNEAVLQSLAAKFAAAEGRWAESLAASEASVEAFDRIGHRFSRTRFLLDWAETHVARGEAGDRERAQELLREAQAAFEEMGISRYATVAQQRLDELEVK